MASDPENWPVTKEFPQSWGAALAADQFLKGLDASLLLSVDWANISLPTRHRACSQSPRSWWFELPDPKNSLPSEPRLENLPKQKVLTMLIYFNTLAKHRKCYWQFYKDYSSNFPVAVADLGCFSFAFGRESAAWETKDCFSGQATCCDPDLKADSARSPGTGIPVLFRCLPWYVWLGWFGQPSLVGLVDGNSVDGQLQEFSVKDSECFCCANHHQQKCVKPCLVTVRRSMLWRNGTGKVQAKSTLTNSMPKCKNLAQAYFSYKLLVLTP